MEKDKVFDVIYVKVDDENVGKRKEGRWKGFVIKNICSVVRTMSGNIFTSVYFILMDLEFQSTPIVSISMIKSIYSLLLTSVFLGPLFSSPNYTMGWQTSDKEARLLGWDHAQKTMETH
jgi:hypothetical protein